MVLLSSSAGRLRVRRARGAPRCGQGISRREADEADNVLRAIVVFGKYDDGATTSADAGISAYNAFVGMMNTELAASSLVTVPATIPSHPGVAVLPPGTYTFTLTGTGDADLYVRLGSAPTLSSYDCRPCKIGSAESCEVHFTEPRTIHVMVRGYAATSTFQIVAASCSNSVPTVVPPYAGQWPRRRRISFRARL